MPKETRMYVPKLMAYRAIVLDPSAYGIVLPQLENHPYFVAVDVGSDIDVALAIKLAEIPAKGSEFVAPVQNRTDHRSGHYALPLEHRLSLLDHYLRQLP